MAAKDPAPVPENWWRDFFVPVVGEVMFAPKAGQSEHEVQHVIKRSKVRPPLKVLDLACGTGRHSVVFAARGFDVTALDYSKPFLREARRAARAARQKIKFVHGDMRDLKPHFAANTFGLVVSLYTSFGYFSRRADDLKTLRAVYRVLRPGGAFVVNTVNGGGVTKKLRAPISIGREPLPNVFVIDKARYDKRNKQTLTSWTIIDVRHPRARVVRKSFSVNVYSHSKLRRLLAVAGFKIDAVWGTLSGGLFDRSKSWHQTIVARKQRSPKS